MSRRTLVGSFQGQGTEACAFFSPISVTKSGLVKVYNRPLQASFLAKLYHCTVVNQALFSLIYGSCVGVKKVYRVGVFII